MQLEQVDSLETETAQAQFGLLAQILRSAKRVPLIRTSSDLARLGGDNQLDEVGMESCTNQLLADIWPIGIRGVDEGDAEVDGAAQHADRLVAVTRFTPKCPGPVMRHGSVSQADDGQYRRRWRRFRMR